MSLQKDLKSEDLRDSAIDRSFLADLPASIFREGVCPLAEDPPAVAAVPVFDPTVT